jgi:hypothetical protein
MAITENIANLRWAKQTAQGTAAASSVFGQYLAGGSQVGATGTNGEFEETTSSRIRSDGFVSERHAEGAPDFYVVPNAIGSLLYGALGAVSTTGASDPYSHEITPASSRPWFTVWRNLADTFYEKSVDCKVDQLTITGSSGQPLMVTASFQGLSPYAKTAAETTATIETSDRFLFWSGDGALQLEGSAVADIREFTLTISNNGELIPGDSVNPIDVSEGQLEIGLSITKLFLVPDLLERLYYGQADPADETAAVSTLLELGGTPSVDFKFTSVAAAPGPERSLQIALPRVELQPYNVQPGTGNSPLTEEIELMVRQPTSGDAITATVLNDLAAY